MSKQHHAKSIWCNTLLISLIWVLKCHLWPITSKQGTCRLNAFQDISPFVLKKRKIKSYQDLCLTIKVQYCIQFTHERYHLWAAKVLFQIKGISHFFFRKWQVPCFVVMGHILCLGKMCDFIQLLKLSICVSINIPQENNGTQIKD